MPEKPKTILLVDDDYDIRTVLCEVLESEGFAVAVAVNGREALNYLEANPVPQLILLDLMMPVMNGFEFREAQTTNPKWADIPVIIMSADGAQQSKEKQERLRGAVFVKKPPDLSDFLDTVHSNVGKS
ncbi:MAG: response regulator [Bdellovibrionales bacterium]|nr:response regulator [Bdellovibrionales bacterium]